MIKNLKNILGNAKSDIIKKQGRRLMAGWICKLRRNYSSTYAGEVTRVLAFSKRFGISVMITVLEVYKLKYNILNTQYLTEYFLTSYVV